MPVTRRNSSSVHSAINAAGSPLAVPLPVHTSSTPSTVPITTPSTSVGSLSTTSILSPDVHLLLQTVRDLSNTSKNIPQFPTNDTMDSWDLPDEALLDPPYCGEAPIFPLRRGGDPLVRLREEGDYG